MRILITGTSGQVGRALVGRLNQHEVVAANRSIIDLSQPDRIAAVLDRFDPAVIINAAAYTAVDQAETEQDIAKTINVQAPGVMAGWAAKSGIPLVHFSTDYVFDGQGSVPRNEDDEAKPLSVYGITKREGELSVQAAGGIHLIIRTSWVYSAIGKNFLRTITRLALEREQLRIVEDQIGAPTSAQLIAVSLHRMLGERIETFCTRCVESKGLVHLTASGETSWYGFACAIIEGLRARGIKLAVRDVVPIATESYPTPAKRPKNSRLDLTRLREVFNITPDNWSTTLESELDSLVSEIKVSSGKI